MKRWFDVTFSLLGVLVAFIPGVLIGLLVRLTSTGPSIYWSNRVGLENKIFAMPKFRTMRLEAPAVATHLLSEPHAWLTPIGRLLRRTSLDELPQIWSILCGDMSFVGPRPALFNQRDLIELRTKYGVQNLKPGLTGWAQINGRDNLTMEEKVELDIEYLERQSFVFDIKILWITLQRVVLGHGVSH
jgi:O-antigen biosynthesis protein WbqP